MATGDRETTLILKAADLSSQTIQTVVAALGRLLEFQEKFNQQAATGSIRTSEFRGNLAELQKVFVALAQQKLAFPEFDRLTAQLDRYTSRLDFLRLKARDLATIPEGERTRQQQRQLDRLTDTDLTPTGQPKGTIARAELARDRVADSYERQKTLLQSMGADLNNLVESQKLLDQAIQHATDGLLQAGAAQRELIPGIVNAREEQQALNEAARQLKAINEAAAASARQQATAIKEATSQAAVFDTAARKAFDAVERGLDKAKGEQFLLSFGDASAEDRQRTEAKLKASRDAAEAEKNAYLVARYEADEENRRLDLATVEARKAEEKKAADAFDIAYASAHDDERRRIKTENEERIKADKLAADKFLLSYSEAIYEKQQREKAARQAQDASDLEASRRKIADFEARRPAPQPYGQASPGVSDFLSTSQGQSGSATQAVRQAFDPEEVNRQTFEGLAAQVRELSASFEVGHKSIKDYHEASRELLIDFAELKQQASVLDLFKQSEQSLQRTARAMLDADERLKRLNAEVTAAGGKDEALNRALEAQRRIVTSTTAAYNSANDTFARNRAAMEAAGLSTANLSEQQAKLVETAKLASATLDKLETVTGKSGTRFRFLGLEQYELVNLSYQINDVFSQFAQGQHVGQIVADQAGQIFQLWDRDIIAVLARLKNIPLALGGIGIAAAAAGFAIMSLVRALDLAAVDRQFKANLALDPDAASNSVRGLQEATKAAEKLGAAYDEAAKGAIELQRLGFSDAQTKQLLVIAQQLATARGRPLADAVKAIGEAFRGSSDDVRKFTQEWAGLGVAEQKSIRDALDAGDLETAHLRLLEALGPRARKAYEESLSETGRAWRNLVNELKEGEEDWSKFWDHVLAKATNNATGIVEKIKAVENGIANIFRAGKRVIGQTPTEEDKPATGGSPGVRGTGSGYSFPGEGFATALSRRENPSGDPSTTNRQGYVGNYQYGSDRLQDVKFDGRPVYTPVSGEGKNEFKGTFNIPGFEDVKTVADFKKSAAAQQAVFFQDYKQVQELIDQLDPQHIFDKEGLHALAHLGGTGALKKFIQSGGTDGADATDANGTRPSDYYREFSRGGPRVAAQASADEQFARQNAERDYRLILETGTADERQKAFDEHLKAIEREVRERAAKIAQQPGGAQPGNVKAEVDRLQEAAKREFDKVNQQRNLEALSADKEVRDRELNADKTNLQARLDANKDFFDQRQRLVDERQAVHGYDNTGITADEATANIAKARLDADNRTRLETAEAIWAKISDEQKARFAAISNDFHNKLIDGATAIKKASDVTSELAPRFRDAAKSATAAIEKVPETDQTKALRAKIDSGLNLSERPPDIRSLTDAGIEDAAGNVQAVSQRRQQEIQAVFLRVQKGTMSLGDAIAAVNSIMDRLDPVVKKTIEEQNTILRSIRAAPTTNEDQIAKIDETLARNEVAEVGRRQKTLSDVIEAALKDGQEKLDKLIKEYQDLVKLATELQKNNQLGPAQEARDKAAALLPQIDAAKASQVANVRLAAATPGLQAGEVASLNQRATAADREGDTHSLNLDTLRGQAKQGLGELNSVMSDLRERQSTEQALLAKGLTTQTAFEEENKRAFEDANTAAAPLIESLQNIVAQMQAAGASAPEIAKITDQIKLLQANLQYIPPLQQQIITGLEQSFVSRGEQAFDAIAKAIAIAITQHGKLKDVIASVGQAFANFAAGVLQDIAKIIIKYELLKLIKDALGIDPNDPTFNAAGGGGGGGGAGGAAGAAGGILGLIGKLFGGGSGAGAGAAGAFDAAGIGSVAEGSSIAADAVGTGTSAFDAVLPLLGVLHTGGEVTSARPDMSRRVDLSLFNEARRMHTGGIVGLNSDEVPAILQKGETVMTKAQMAMKKTQEGMSAGGPSFRNVLAVGDKEIASAMNSSHGEQVVLNILRRNTPTVKQYLG